MGYIWKLTMLRTGRSDFLFYRVTSSIRGHMKVYHATTLSYDNQHLFFFFETKTCFFPPSMQNLIQEVICSFVGWKQNLVYAGLNQWNLLWVSLLLPATEIKPALRSMCGPCAPPSGRRATWPRNSPIFFLKADNATGVSVRIQITNKCWTLLNALYTLSWVEHTIFWTYDDSLFIWL